MVGLCQVGIELQRPVHRLPGQGEPLRRPIHKPGVEVDVRAGQARDHFGEVGIQLDGTFEHLYCDQDLVARRQLESPVEVFARAEVELVGFEIRRRTTPDRKPR